MCSKGEGCHSTKIRAAPAHSPEEIGVVLFGGGQDAAVGEDDSNREQVVDCQAVFTAQPSETAAERESGNPSMVDSTFRKLESDKKSKRLGTYRQQRRDRILQTLRPHATRVHHPQP